MPPLLVRGVTATDPFFNPPEGLFTESGDLSMSTTSPLGTAYLTNRVRKCLVLAYGADRAIGDQMAKPYHTVLYELYGEHHRNVYHDKKKCPAGKRIKPKHRRKGADHRERCKQCIDRDKS